MTKVFGFFLFLASSLSFANELQFQFNSPSFSGIGYSSHILTIQQLENQAVSQNQAAAQSLAAQAAAASANTPQAQFVSNLQSRIYSQLAQQITNSLFGDNGSSSCTTSTTCPSGEVDVGGNTISWKLGVTGTPDAGIIIIHIQSDSTGQYTNMKIPVGTFYF